MLRAIFLISVALLVGCMPSSGPSPNEVLVVRVQSCSINDLLNVMDSLSPLLDRKINKHSQFGDIYSSAYWYPYRGSEIYGVAVVEWDQSLTGEGMGDMKGRYFVEVYADGTDCPLCAKVRAALSRNKIPYFSACDHLNSSTQYERTRCGS